MPLNILAIETSCDETSAAILMNYKVLSNVVSSQEFHSRYGGIVPELASRAQIEIIDRVTDKALRMSGIGIQDINLAAATRGPGLIGSLLTGLNYAKAFAVAKDIEFTGVNHIESHLYSCFIGKKEIDFPFIALVVSGGHTILSLVTGYFEYKVLGRTQDDAAGEAFDKAAKMLGLGYPGGPLIDKEARRGNENFHKFPISRSKENRYDFSFSGIKTSLLYYLKKNYQDIPADKIPVADICASFQKAVVMSLVEKAIGAAEEYGIRNIAVSGGVSANSSLRENLLKFQRKGYRIYFPALEYTTDNAAMVGYAAYLRYNFAKGREDYFRKSILEPAFVRFTD